MRNALITRSAFITLCTKIARHVGFSSDFVDVHRFGEDFVIWRDAVTDTGIARLCLGCSGKPDARGTVRLAEHKTDKGYIRWSRNAVEGNRCDLTQALTDIVMEAAVECKFNPFPKFELIPAEHNLITLEELVEFVKKNGFKPTKFTLDTRYIENINAVAPYGCTCSSFANWDAPHEMIAPLHCQTLWSFTYQWEYKGKEISLFEPDCIKREDSDKSPVKEINGAYGWGWERDYGNYRHWTQQCKIKNFKCWFWQKYLQWKKKDPYYWADDVKEQWIGIDSLEKVQAMIDECKAATGFDFYYKEEA